MEIDIHDDSPTVDDETEVSTDELLTNENGTDTENEDEEIADDEPFPIEQEFITDYSYLASDRSPITEKPSISNAKGIEIQVYEIGNINYNKIINFGAGWSFSLGLGSKNNVSKGINLVFEPG